MFNFDAYFGGIFWIWAKNQGGGGGGRGWTNSQGKSRKADTLCLLEFWEQFFNLAKFYPNRRDSMYHPCLVLWKTQS